MLKINGYDGCYTHLKFHSSPLKSYRNPKRKGSSPNHFFLLRGLCKTSGVPCPSQERNHPRSSSHPPKTWHASARRARARIARKQYICQRSQALQDHYFVDIRVPLRGFIFFFKEDVTFWITVLDSMFNIAVLTILAQSFLMQQLQYQRAFY